MRTEIASSSIGSLQTLQLSEERCSLAADARQATSRNSLLRNILPVSYLGRIPWQGFAGYHQPKSQGSSKLRGFEIKKILRILISRQPDRPKQIKAASDFHSYCWLVTSPSARALSCHPPGKPFDLFIIFLRFNR